MTTAPLVILISGASTGFGLLTARTLAQAGHVVYAGNLHPYSKSPDPYDDAAAFSREHSVQLKGTQLDVTSDESCKTCVDEIIATQGKIDVVVHNAGHMNFGPGEAFTPEQFMRLYDVNCLGCHRLNRQILPHMRTAHSGLLLWISSSSAHGPSSPFLSGYFAAKAAQDSLAQTTSLEVSQFGIETSIAVPGVFTKGTNHFLTAMGPQDGEVERVYTEGVYKGWDSRCLEGSAKMIPEDADPQLVADAVAGIVKQTRGQRPFRVHVETEGKCAEAVNEVRDRVREEFLGMMGCEELLRVKIRCSFLSIDCFRQLFPVFGYSWPVLLRGFVNLACAWTWTLIWIL